MSTAGGGNNAGAFDSYQGSFSMAYKATKWLTLDTGGRFVHQLFQGVTIVPWSYTVFVGLTLGYDIPIARFR